MMLINCSYSTIFKPKKLLHAVCVFVFVYVHARLVRLVICYGEDEYRGIIIIHDIVDTTWKESSLLASRHCN